MTQTLRPTNCLDVEADMLARADFRGITDDAGRRAYLLGMATAMLAEANRQLNAIEHAPDGGRCPDCGAWPEQGCVCE